MATMQEVHTAIRTAIKEQIEDGQDGGTRVTVQYPNTSITPPTELPWIELEIIPVNRNQTALGGAGNNTYRYLARARVSCCCPLGIGDNAITEIAARVVAAFRNQSSNTIKFKPADPDSSQRTAGRYQIVVNCQVYSDQIA